MEKHKGRRDLLIERLVSLVTPSFIEGMVSIYVSAEDSVGPGGPVTRRFQELLKLIPSWNLETRQAETRRIDQAAPQLTRLLRQCVQASARVMGTSSETPKALDFVHRVYMRVARQAWMNPRMYAVNTESFNYGSCLHVVGQEVRAAVLDYLVWDETSEGDEEDYEGDEAPGGLALPVPAPIHASTPAPHAQSEPEGAMAAPPVPLSSQVPSWEYRHVSQNAPHSTPTPTPPEFRTVSVHRNHMQHVEPPPNEMYD